MGPFPAKKHFYPGGRGFPQDDGAPISATGGVAGWIDDYENDAAAFTLCAGDFVPRRFTSEFTRTPCVWASELSLCVCEQQEAPLAFAWYSWCHSLEKQTVWPITLKRFQLSVCPSLISVRAVLITTSSMLVFITSFPKTNWKPSLIGKADGYKSKTIQSSWADWKPDRRCHKLISLTDWEDGSMGCWLVFMLTFTCVDTVSCSLIKNSSNEFLINKAALNRVCMWSLVVFLSTVDGYCPTLNNCQQGSCRSGVFRIQKYI